MTIEEYDYLENIKVMNKSWKIINIWFIKVENSLKNKNNL
jgi:hypothetical protein